MTSSIVLPSISLSKSAFGKSISSVRLGFENEIRRVSRLNLDISRLFMSLAVRSKAAIVDDVLFKDYKPSTAFLFSGQGAQAVGMGVKAQSQKVLAAAEL